MAHYLKASIKVSSEYRAAPLVIKFVRIVLLVGLNVDYLRKRLFLRIGLLVDWSDLILEGNLVLDFFLPRLPGYDVIPIAVNSVFLFAALDTRDQRVITERLYTLCPSCLISIGLSRAFLNRRV